MEKIKVAAASIISKNFEVKRNIDEILKKAKLAKSNNAKYIFFGEAAINGFDGLTWTYEEDITKHAINENDEEIRTIRDYCKDNKIGIGVGFYEKADQKLYCTYIIINENGNIISKYRRISPGWKEKYADSTFYIDGTEYEFFNLGNSKCLMSVCGDLWTPEYIEELKDFNFDTIIWPLYISYSKEDWDSHVKSDYARKIAEIGKRAILINSEGDDAIGSLVEFSSEGEIINEAELPSEKIIYFSL